MATHRTAFPHIIHADAKRPLTPSYVRASSIAYPQPKQTQERPTIRSIAPYPSYALCIKSCFAPRKMSSARVILSGVMGQAKLLSVASVISRTGWCTPASWP